MFHETSPAPERVLGEARRRAGSAAHATPARLRPRRPPEAAVRPTRRLHAEALARLATPSARTFWTKADTTSPEAYEKSMRVVPRLLPQEVIGKLPEPTLPLNPRTRQIYDEPKWTGYEVDARRLPGRVRLRHPAAAEGPEAGREAAGGRLPARPRRPADRRHRSREEDAVLQLLRRRSSPTSATSSTRRRTRTSARTTFRQLQRKANPLKLSLFSLHRPPARAHARLARNAAVRRPEADRVLRPQLRRQDRDARAGHREALLPVDLLRRLQRVGREERLGRSRPAATCSRASTTCTSSTWATRSTTRRWPS